MAKTNYNQAKRQKENARKARQQEKLAKKLARVSGDPDTADSPDAASVPMTDAPVAATETKEAQ